MTLGSPSTKASEDSSSGSDTTLSSLFWLCAGLRFLSSIPLVIDDDESWWAAAAHKLSTPFRFYFESVDHKPPGIVWFCWAVEHLFGRWGEDPRVIRAVFSVSVVAAAWIIRKMATRHFSAGERTGWLAAVIFLAASALPSPKLLALTADGLMCVLVVLGYAIAFSGPALLAGAVLGLALLVKQTAVFAAIPLLFSVTPRRWTPREIALMIVGSALVVIPSVVASNPSEMIYWIWTYPREVLIAVRKDVFSITDLIANAAAVGLAALPVFLALRGARAGFRDFRVLWLLSALAIIAMGQGLFLHYYLMLMPPLALLAAQGFGERRLRAWEGLWIFGGYALNCLAVLSPMANVTWGTDLPYFRELDRALESVVHPDQEMMVWGGSSIPLAALHARYATRFVTPRFAVTPYGNEKTRSAFYDELGANPPSIVLDLHERGDNTFGLPIESEPVVAALVRGYHLYVDPAIPWAKLYSRDAISRPEWVEVVGDDSRKRVYTEFPQKNPAWRSFEALAAQPSLTTAMALDEGLRLQEALELASLQAPNESTRALASEMSARLKSEIESGDWVLKTPAERSNSLLSGTTLLAQGGGMFPMPFRMPEWWFTVSISQMQPRVTH